MNGVHGHTDNHALLDVNPVVSYVFVAFTFQSKQIDFNYLLLYHLFIFNFTEIFRLFLRFTCTKVNTNEELH